MHIAGGIFCATLFAVAANAKFIETEANLIVPYDGPAAEWWSNAVFYQIYPRSFKDSDGDGIGDIQGIISQLDYLKDLGIDAAWLSPIFKSPMADFGYDISDFYDVDPTFGNLTDIEQLFKEAKEKGIKIILDFVPNHSSDQNEWFKKSLKNDEKYGDFYIWRQGRNNNTEPPNNWQSIFYGPAWTYREERKLWYYHQFAKEQPDLNYRIPAVREQMKDVLIFWLGKGASGFRIDAINHLYEDEQLRDEPLSNRTDDPLSHDYTEHIYTRDLPEVYEMVYEFRATVDAYARENNTDEIVLMTEAYTNDTEYPKYFQSADGKQKGSQMPFNFVLIEQVNKTSTDSDLKAVIDKRIAAVSKETRLNWVIGNHDQPRVGSRFGERKIEGFLTLVMTLPGIAVTYNGEEIGMVDNRDGITFEQMRDPQAINQGINGSWLELSRDPERTPFQWSDAKFAGFMNESSTEEPWLPIHPNYRDINVAAQQTASRSTLKYYKELLELRKHDTFAYGSYESTILHDNVFAYVRAREGNETFVVLINFGAREEVVNATELSADFTGKADVVVAGADTCYLEGDKLQSDRIVLHKYATVILKPASCCDGRPNTDPINSSTTANAASLLGLLAVVIARFIF